MFGFSIRTRQNATNSPRSTSSPSFGSTPRPLGTSKTAASPKTEVGVGEIDTRAPFQSVRAAVSLFADAGPSPKAPPAVHKVPKTGEERVLEKETQHHLTIKKLENLQEHLKSTEAIRYQALKDLEIANRTLENLTNKLEIASESKQAAMLITEASKRRIEELEERESSKARVGGDAWKLDVDSERDQYKASSAQLISAKQELTNLRQDFDAALVAKLSGFQEAADAQHKTRVHRERVKELTREISNMRETLSQVKVASQQAKEEHAKLIAEKEGRTRSHNVAKGEIEKKIESLKEEFKSGFDDNIQEKLDGTNEAITLFQEQLNTVRASDQNALRTVTSELESAKRELHEIVSEENSLRSLVDLLKLELDNAKREHFELEKAAIEAESATESLQIDLQNCKSELEAINAGEIKLKDDSDETYLNIQQLSLEAETARREAEESNKEAELLKHETETALFSAKRIEEQLQIALQEAEEAKSAETLANNQIRNPSRKEPTQATNSESNGKIKLPSAEYEALSKKVEQSKADADMKVATAMAQAETIRSNENQVLKQLEVSQKENMDLKAAIDDALRQAEMSEGAKKVVEGELRRWREKEQNAAKAEAEDEAEEPSFIQLGGAS